MKFMLNSGLDESHEEGTSYYNISEIALAVDTVRSLLSASALDSSLDIKPSEIAVMSPFREQVKRLRTAFRAAGYRSVNVGPIESYQVMQLRCLHTYTLAYHPKANPGLGRRIPALHHLHDARAPAVPGRRLRHGQRPRVREPPDERGADTGQARRHRHRQPMDS